MANSGEPLMLKYLHDKGAKEGVPVSGTFELTQRCNFNCEMCYVHDANKKDDPLTCEQWLELGRQAQKAGTILLLLTGGEPLIRKDFDDIYIGLIKMGFLISINTNGSLVDKHIEVFKKYPPARFNISIYGADDVAYNNLCHVRQFNKVISNIKLLRDNGMTVKINLVATPANGMDCLKIIDIANDLGTIIKPTAYAYPAIRLGKVDNEARYSPEVAAKYSVMMDKYRYEPDFFKGKMRYIHSLQEGPLRDKVLCRAGSCTFWITADGIMRPCGMMPEPDAYPIRDGFAKAWEETKANTNAIPVPEECKTCKYSGVCMVCAAMCKAETGEFDKKPEYVCQMMKKLYELSEKELEGDTNEN